MKSVRTVIIPSPQARKWKRDGEEKELAKKFGLKLVSQHFIGPDSQRNEFVYCRKAPGVTTLVITDDGNVVLVGQFKQGLGQFVFEVPAGMVAEGDDFQAKALDEVAKESGFRGEEIESLCGTPSCPGPRKFATAEHLFVVRGARHVGGQELDPTEFIEVIVVSPDVFERMCDDGEIVSSGTREAFYRAVAKG